MTTNGMPIEPTDAEIATETAALANRPVEPGSLLAIIKEAAVNKADAETMRELLNVWKDAKADQAAEAFAEALVQFRRGVRPVLMTGVRDDRTSGGSVHYRYAELTTTIEQIQPILDQCQLTPTWRMTKNEPNYVELECLVTHRLRHKESSGPFGSPVGEGRKGQTAVQVRQGVVTSIKRATLFMVLGLTTTEDDNHLRDAEQGENEKKPESPGDPEDEIKKQFWNACQKKAGASFTATQVRAIFAKVQELRGHDSAMECLTYLQRQNVMVGKDGNVSLVDESPVDDAPVIPFED